MTLSFSFSDVISLLLATFWHKELYFILLKNMLLCLIFLIFEDAHSALNYAFMKFSVKLDPHMREGSRWK